MNASLRKSVADVILHKGRTLLVAASIFLGVFSLTGLASAKDTLLSAIAFTIENQSAQPDILMSVDRLDDALLPKLQTLPNIRAVQYETDLFTLWLVNRPPGYVSIKITSFPDLHNVPITPFELVQGTYPQDGEILMEYGDQRLQSIQVGDQVTVQTPHGPAHLRVSGLVRTPGANPAISEKAIGYMTEAELRNLGAFTNNNAPNNTSRQELVGLKVHDATQLQVNAHNLTNFFTAHQVQVFAVGFPASSSLPTNPVQGAFTMLSVLAMLAVVISGLLIFSTVTTLLVEQMAIIGTMKAIGATQSTIRKGYLLTIGFYCLLATLPGTFLGIIIGRLTAQLIASQIPLALGPLQITPTTLLLAFGAGFLIPLAAGWLAVWNGTRVSVHQALASYGVNATDDRRPSHRFPFKIKAVTRLSQFTWLGLHNLTRRPARSVWILIVLTLAGISFMAVQVLITSVNSTVQSVYAPISAQIEVDGGEQTSFSKMQELLMQQSDVQRVERYGLVGANTVWGRLVVWGFEPDTQIYHYHLISGRWFQAGETDVALISEDLSRKSGLTVGSVLEATNPADGRSASWRVIGVVQQPLDSMGVVGAVVLPVNSLYSFQGAAADHVADAAFRMLVQVTDSSPSAIDTLTNQIGSLARNTLVTDSSDKEGEITNVFLMQNEINRRQLNWVIPFSLLECVTLIVGLAAALGLANELAAAALERKREIGMLRASGAQTSQIVQVFWVEGIALGLLAGCLAGVLGIPLSAALIQLFGRMVMPVAWQVSPLVFGLLFPAILAIISLATLWIRRSIAGMRTEELLRYE